jgi:hypothetical protein
MRHQMRLTGGGPLPDQPDAPIAWWRGSGAEVDTALPCLVAVRWIDLMASTPPAERVALTTYGDQVGLPLATSRGPVEAPPPSLWIVVFGPVLGPALMTEATAPSLDRIASASASWPSHLDTEWRLAFLTSCADELASLGGFYGDGRADRRFS